MGTEGALLGCSGGVFFTRQGIQGGKLVPILSTLVLIKVHGPVRTGRHAGLGATAFVLVHQNDSILTFGDGSGGTGLQAGSVFTLVAEGGNKEACGIRILADLLVKNGGIPDAGRSLVLYFTSQGAGIAANA